MSWMSVLHFFEKLRHVVDVVDGQVAAGAQHFGLAAGERVGDAGLRQPVEAHRLVAHLVFAGLDDAQHLAVEVVHIDNAVHGRLLLAHGTLDGGNLGGARRHVEDADVLGGNALFGETLLDIFGRHVERRFQAVDIIDQHGEFHLDETHDGGTERRDDRFLARGVAAFQIAPVVFLEEVHTLLDLIDALEADVQQRGEDGALTYLLLELGEEDGGHQQHWMLVVENRLEVVLLDVDGVHRAGDVAPAAIDAAVRVEHGMPVLHMYRARGAHARAVRASDTEVVFEFQRVVEIFGHDGLRVKV